jgi:hypothetical protein
MKFIANIDKQRLILIVALSLLTLCILGFALVLISNKGDVDRWMAGLGADSATERDLIYQTGSVRVYAFDDNNTRCYLADNKDTSTSIYCIKKD